MVNAALYLRRPLLVTGSPGTGKSHAGPRRRARAGARPGAALADHQPRRPCGTACTATTRSPGCTRPAARARTRARYRTAPADIGSYIRLGPLGTALLPAERPRVLLIDEIDKSDIDLPNDLLNVFEEGEFEHPRAGAARRREPGGRGPDRRRQPDGHGHATGRVRCRAFPLRRAHQQRRARVPARVPAPLHPPRAAAAPTDERLSAIVRAHLGDDGRRRARRRARPAASCERRPQRTAGHRPAA